MTNRSERLASYLESHGWVIYDNCDKYCSCDPALNHKDEAVYCYRCGNKLTFENSNDVLNEIEYALQYALGEV